MLKLAHLIDSIDYINNNCFQHQLQNVIKKNFNITQIPVIDMSKTDFSTFDVILSTIKLRNVLHNVQLIKSQLQNRKIFIYDQDPWESFVDQLSFKGAYTTISSHLNVESFLNTSKHWCDIINEQGFSSKFVRMWILREYCIESKIEWLNRQIHTGFIGTLHPYRKDALVKLSAIGIETKVFPSQNYQSFLNTLENMKFFFHVESDENWTIDGHPIEKNLCWIKDIEIASRGCVAIRKYDSELIAYDVPNIPSIVTYTKFSDITEIIKQDYSRESKQGFEFIRDTAQNAWMDLVEVISQ